jgi:hypothetical protein
VAVSLAGRRWGPTVAGLLGGFPVVAGPILLVVTIVQGNDFGADAAAGSVLGLTAVAASAVVYARVAPRLSPPLTLLAAWATFFAGVGLLGALDVSPVVAFLIAVVSFELSRLLVRVPGESEPHVLPMPWWDLPARALSALLLVLAVTIAADALDGDAAGDDGARATVRQRARSTPATFSASSSVEHAWWETIRPSRTPITQPQTGVLSAPLARPRTRQVPPTTTRSPRSS